MSLRVCLVQPDLSSIRLVEGDREETWRAEAVEGEPDALALRGRAEQAAAWVKQQAAGGIDLALLDVSESACLWVASPSERPEVVELSMRQMSNEWEELGVGRSAHPLTERAAEAARKTVKVFGVTLRQGEDEDRPSGLVRLPTIAMIDALVRLWLDQLDRAGSEARVVGSLWHGACQVWGGGEGRTIVVLEDGARLIWGWGDGGRLRCAGVASAPPEGDDLEWSASRLAMDWLTWCAQLREEPGRIVVVGGRAQKLCAALRKAWPDAPAEAEVMEDAVGATLRSLSAEGSTPGEAEVDPRLALVRLTRRRGRQHRWLYTCTGSAMAVLAVAVGGLGMRQLDASDTLRAEAQRLRAEAREVASVAAPEVAGSPDLGRALQSSLLQVRGQRADFEDPAPVRPVQAELGRLLGILASMAPSGVTVEDVTMSELYPQASVLVPEFSVGEELAQRLRESQGAVRWTATFVQDYGQQKRYRLTGQWGATQ